MLWFVIGLVLGYGIGLNHRLTQLPDELEQCNAQRSQQDIDIAYYKKLTKTWFRKKKNLPPIFAPKWAFPHFPYIFTKFR